MKKHEIVALLVCDKTNIFEQSFFSGCFKKRINFKRTKSLTDLIFVPKIAKAMYNLPSSRCLIFKLTRVMFM